MNSSSGSVHTMEYMHEISPGEILIFRWRENGTTIEVGRPENEEYTWDQSISVYDHATGKRTIETYEDFRARIDGWLKDQQEMDNP